MTTSPTRRVGAALTAVTGLAASAALLTAAGRTLPFPPDLHPHRLAAWAAAEGAPTVAFTTLRALAVVLVGWCCLGWTFGVVARLTRRAGAVRVADRVSLPLVRRLADAAAGLAVVGATLSPVAVAAAPAGPEVSVVVMTDLGPATRTTTTTEPSPTTTAGREEPVALAPPTDRTRPAAQPLAPVAQGTTWVIAPGDTLWHLAEASLVDELGTVPSAAEVQQRLDLVVATNRDRLAVPEDPGLVFPGQEFLLP